MSALEGQGGGMRALAGDSGGVPALRVVIADDQVLVRTGFRMILMSEGIDVVGEAAQRRRGLRVVRETRPDVVLMDIRMPGMDGLEATRLILAEGGAMDPEELPRVIILTTFDLDQYVYAAITAGASGFLLKDVSPEHLVAAVRMVRAGDAMLAPAITRRLVERFAVPTVNPRRRRCIRTLRRLRRGSEKCSACWAAACRTRSWRRGSTCRRRR